MTILIVILCIVVVALSAVLIVLGIRVLGGKGEKNAVLEIRTHFLYYLKGLEGSSEIKNMICKETSYENIIKILDNYLIQLDNLL